MRTGRIRDGHGDLAADKVYLLPDGPRVLDCAAYDQRVRVGDVLGDVASLAMDLERLGTAAAAERFLGWHREFSEDTCPLSFQDVYVAHHALRQAAAAGDRHGHGEPGAAGEARLLADLALTHLHRAQLSESAT
jgi:aminoglycoside phosphotransferase family enzyme